MSSESEIEQAKRKLKLLAIKRKLRAYSASAEVTKGITKTGKVLKRILKI